MSRDNILPKARTDNLVLKELEDEVLVYDTERHTAFCLNAPARLIMQHCDGKTSIGVAQVSIKKELGTDLSEDMLWLAIDELRKADLLENPGSQPFISTGVSRRQMIRNAAAVGLAIPVISALVAPAASQVLSCTPNGFPCTLGVPPPCCPGLSCQNLEGFRCAPNLN